MYLSTNRFLTFAISGLLQFSKTCCTFSLVLHEVQEQHNDNVGSDIGLSDIQCDVGNTNLGSMVPLCYIRFRATSNRITRISKITCT